MSARRGGSVCQRLTAAGTVVGTLLAVTSVLWAVRPVKAQEPIPASLLRRLAETADAGRTGRPLWIVAQVEFPHQVGGVYGTADSAIALARALSGYREFGPFVTPPDLGPLPDPAAVILPCPHDKWTTMAYGRAPDVEPTPAPSPARPTDRARTPTAQGQGMICPEGPFSVADILNMNLVIETRTRGTIRVALPPERVDAIFFDLNAYDKFFVPYYARLYGPEYAARLRAEIVGALRRR